MSANSNGGYFGSSTLDYNIGFFSLLKRLRYLIFPMLAIQICSILCLYSASGGSMQPWALKQMIYVIMGLILFAFIVRLKPRTIMKYTNHLCVISFLLLLLVMVVGRKTMGASRWIDLGFFKVQPSEIAKLACVLFVAKFMSSIKSRNVSQFRTYIFATFLLCFLIVPIALQPDLATAMIVLLTCSVMFFLIGIPRWQIVFVFLNVLLLIPIIWFKFLREYQKLRVINFLFPENDPLGSGYNVIQSKIAIGSGEFLGKGFLAGTQGRLRFLPEHHTDFIFTLIGEEFGFIGCIFILFLYSMIVFYGFRVAKKTNSVFGKMVCIGCATLLFFHVFVNIGMTIGILPVAGIPLAMLSYGGSSMLLGVACVAFIANIDIHRNVD